MLPSFFSLEHPLQAAPPTVLGLGQASPLTTPGSPRRSPSPPLRTECQLATPVLHHRLHEADSVLSPGVTSLSYRQPGAVAATASATGESTPCNLCK